MLVAAQFVESLISKYECHPVYSDGCTLYQGGHGIGIEILFSLTLQNKHNRKS